jgi:hypothetical protein
MHTLKSEFETFASVTRRRFLDDAPVVEAPHWQSTKAPAPMVELLNVSLTLDLGHSPTLSEISQVVRPNLPWADLHFEQERVSGEPINPGETWKVWPYGHSAAKHLREGENIAQYDHSYAERYWPKFAGSTDDGRFGPGKGARPIMNGYRFPIGDLNDLVAILVKDPLTRQAYLPVWFPEDLAAARLSKRVPCTLGYHFIMRDDQLHVVYPMRSCDFIRHFRDDVYLTIRLLYWVLWQCQTKNPTGWGQVRPGTFTMHMTSLHMFTVDRDNLRADPEYGLPK